MIVNFSKGASSLRFCVRRFTVEHNAIAASSFHVSVKRIIANVGLTVWEPVVEVLVLLVEDFCIRLVPVDILSCLVKVGLWVFCCLFCNGVEYWGLKVIC